MDSAIIRVDGDRRVYSVGAWHLESALDDAEPRVRDAHLGTMLGYAKAADIRKLIDRMVADGELLENELIATVAKSGGRPAREVWLTEEQALLLCARSDAPRARDVRRDLVRVYIAVRHGALQTHVDAGLLIQGMQSAIVQAIAALDERAERRESALELRLLDAMNKRFADAAAAHHVNGTVGRRGASRIRAALRMFADNYTGEDRKSKAWKSCWKKADNDLRVTVSFTIRAWGLLPSSKEGDVTGKLEDMLRVSRDMANQRQAIRVRQMGIAFPNPDAAE
jgi:hypothetical protein